MADKANQNKADIQRSLLAILTELKDRAPTRWMPIPPPRHVVAAKDEHIIPIVVEGAKALAAEPQVAREEEEKSTQQWVK
ncbi:hypothetical protein Tco_1253647 [Tanacetum coccineum]